MPISRVRSALGLLIVGYTGLGALTVAVADDRRASAILVGLVGLTTAAIATGVFSSFRRVTAIEKRAGRQAGRLNRQQRLLDASHARLADEMNDW